MIPTSKSRLQNLTLDIRAQVASLVHDHEKIDVQDVRTMLRKAASKAGGLTEKDAKDLAWVKERYKDKFTGGALKMLESVVGGFVEAELERMKEHDRQKKIDKEVAEVEERVQRQVQDRKLRALGASLKEEVLLTRVFNVKRRKFH